MNEANAVQFLAYLGSPNAELHGDWIRSSCPLAFHRHKSGVDKNPSFGIRYNPTGRSGYNCFSCNVRSKALTDLIPEIQYALKQVAQPPPLELGKAFALADAENEIGYHGSEWTGSFYKVEHPFEEWPGWWLESFAPVANFPLAVEYLQSRKVAQKLWVEFDLRFDTQKKTVCFPFRTRSNKMAGMRGRFLKPKGDFRHYDYKWNGINNTALVFLGEHHVDYMQPLVIVEGAFDYARVYPVYKNVIANLSTGLSEQKVKKLETAIEVVGLFDDDEAGAIASKMLGNRLHASYRATVYPEKASGDDPGSLTSAEIRSMLKPYCPV